MGYVIVVQYLFFRRQAFPPLKPFGRYWLTSRFVLSRVSYVFDVVETTALLFG